LLPFFFVDCWLSSPTAPLVNIIRLVVALSVVSRHADVS
jgi:hypothetical protein